MIPKLLYWVLIILHKNWPFRNGNTKNKTSCLHDTCQDKRLYSNLVSWPAAAQPVAFYPKNLKSNLGHLNPSGITFPTWGVMAGLSPQHLDMEGHQGQANQELHLLPPIEHKSSSFKPDFFFFTLHSSAGQCSWLRVRFLSLLPFLCVRLCCCLLQSRRFLLLCFGLACSFSCLPVCLSVCLSEAG